MMECDNNFPSQGPILGGNGSSSEELWDYIPEEIFPKDAVEKGHHKYLRTTGDIEVQSVNESNKAIVDEYIEYFRENFPEKAEGKSNKDILLENDDIWEKGLYDDLLVNSLKNGDYILEDTEGHGYIKKGVKAKELRDLVYQFDVVIQRTIVGFVCKPFVVFGYKTKHTWGAEQVYDDYAREKMEEFHEWRKTVERDTSHDYNNLEIELFKQGHIHFKLKDYGVDCKTCIRKVNHKDSRKGVSHDIW